MATDTTIRLTKDTKRKLSAMKVHPNQPFEEVILDLINWRNEGEDLLAAKKARKTRKG